MRSDQPALCISVQEEGVSAEGFLFLVSFSSGQEQGQGYNDCSIPSRRYFLPSGQFFFHTRFTQEVLNMFAVRFKSFSETWQIFQGFKRNDNALIHIMAPVQR